MTQYATVKKIIDDNKALITVMRESSCGRSCASCAGCSAKSKVVTAVANNLCGADVGERVCVEMPTKEVLGIVSAVYILPLIFLLAAAFFANLLGAGEGICILSGAFGFVAAFLLVKKLNSWVSQKNVTEINIISVVNGEQ